MQVLDVKLPFDEMDVLTRYLPHIRRSVRLSNVSVQSADGPDVPDGIVDQDGPLPAEPKFVLQALDIA
jgi:hypothetical protein